MPESCKILKPVLQNGPKDLFQNFIGNYVLSGIENGKQYWQNYAEETAIWYDEEFTDWVLGYARQEHDFSFFEKKYVDTFQIFSIRFTCFKK